MREMRLLLYQLRETGVEEDIQSALEVRFNQVERRLGIHATCEVSGDILLPRNIRYEVWRILVEALNNCIKHANATKVSVALSINRHRLYLTVQDDGIGFNTLLSSHGMGLMNMQSRSDSIGGSFSVVSSPGKGTKVILEVPLPENNFGGS
jgi:two-component system NarL family sensor kinase